MIMLDTSDKRPIYEQIVARYKEFIALGILGTDEKIPSVRQLAIDMSINPNTIQRAYSTLEREGYIYTIKGRGNFVADISHMLPQRQERFYKEFDELLAKADSYSLDKDALIAHIEEFYKGEA